MIQRSFKLHPQRRGHGAPTVSPHRSMSNVKIRPHFSQPYNQGNPDLTPIYLPFLCFPLFLLNFSLFPFHQESVEGEHVSCVGFSALQRCSFTPSTAQIKVGFSLAHVEILKSVLRNSLTSPGEEFWNAAIECADGISA